MQYADVILPLSLQGVYTYSVSADIGKKISAGCRVIVQFGKKKFYTAIVCKVYQTEEKKDNLKEITSLLDPYPIVTPIQLKFWEWIASYYICTLGDVYKAALPAALKLESETYVIADPDFIESEPLKPALQKAYHCLSASKAQKISEIAKISGITNIVPVIKSLVDLGAAFLSEDITKGYTAKTISAVRLADPPGKTGIQELIEKLSRAKKQQALLEAYLHLAENNKVVLKKNLLETAHASEGVLKELTEKGILEIYGYEINRIDYGKGDIDSAHSLNTYQQKAYQEIGETFNEKDITLLFGVTSSGKTEIYIQLIKDILLKGGQALYLLPEIALTTQITDRLRKVFGDRMAVYHSKFNDNERAEVWNKLLRGECDVVLGARSAIFLPFNSLKLIIVDEEHEGSYKQQDPAPRYHARNAATVLASMHGAKTLLGTATPAIETYYNAIAGKYGLVRLTKRHDDIKLPHIEVINTKDLRRRKLMKSILSPPLAEHMRNAFANGEQVILFQNRRGFASMLECKTCSWTPRCIHCDVSLTYHKRERLMVCHYCGATYAVPATCPECETQTLDILGYGTERIEEEVKEYFPEAVIARMDMDTTRSRRAYECIIGDFAAGKANVLVGTQMVSKGLDFDNVSVVGILNADNMLNYPDFRAHERAYQLMTQVSGRSGRKNKQGLVALQTSHPGHPVITSVRENNYESFYTMQADERRMFRYPPFYRLTSVIIKGKEEHTLDTASRLLAQSLRQSFGERVYGPIKPPVSRIQSLYIRKVLLKLENRMPVQKVREALLYHQHSVLNTPEYRSLLVQYDVDPV